MNMLRITQINYENPYKMKNILNSPDLLPLNAAYLVEKQPIPIL
jgi:hypothetical protein